MPESIGLGGTIIAISASLTFLSGIFLGLRLYCKLVRRRSFWWDDHVLIAAWICLVICVALTIFDVSLGFGKDISKVNPANVPTIALTGTLYGLFACLAVAWSKTSFALTLLRLESGWKYWFLWFLIITMNVIMNLVIVFSFVKCTPARKVWHSSLPGTCWNPLVATYYNVFAGAYLGLVDLILCVFAWTIIWKLSMRTREKIGVGIALTFGIFAAAAAGAKCFGMLGLSSPNRTLARAGIFIWSMVEIAVTIMAASIPIMRILVLRVCRLNRHQLSNRPLRRLRTISSRNKRPSANVRTSSDNNNTGAGEVSAREDGLSNVTLIPSIDSIRQNDIDMYRIDTTLSVV